MKLITSIVRPDKVDAVKSALAAVHVSTMTIRELHDHGPQRHDRAVWRGREFNVGFSLKMEIALVVHDDDVDQVVEAILRTARTGAVGDGHVAVAPIDHRYNIRTGARDVSDG